jgi:hypothetical protein
MSRFVMRRPVRVGDGIAAIPTPDWAALGRDPFVIDAMPGAANADRASSANEDCGLWIGE